MHGEIGRQIELKELTAMMDRVGAKTASASQMSDPDKAMRMFDEANQEAEAIGILAEQNGYTIDEVVAPLWEQ